VCVCVCVCARARVCKHEGERESSGSKRMEQVGECAFVKTKLGVKIACKHEVTFKGGRALSTRFKAGAAKSDVHDRVAVCKCGGNLLVLSSTSVDVVPNNAVDADRRKQACVVRVPRKECRELLVVEHRLTCIPSFYAAIAIVPEIPNTQW
jgi:hypothetical protein